MFSWLKAFFSFKSPSTLDANVSARKELDRLRRDELSVGAHMRRGEPVKTFPGLTSGSLDKQKVPASMAKPASSNVVGNTTMDSSGGDFVTSMLVGAGTGSTMMGYAVGGSLTGAVVGSSMRHETPAHTPSSTCEPSACQTSSESGSDSGSSDF